MLIGLNQLKKTRCLVEKNKLSLNYCNSQDSQTKSYKLLFMVSDLQTSNMFENINPKLILGLKNLNINAYCLILPVQLPKFQEFKLFVSDKMNREGSNTKSLEDIKKLYNSMRENQSKDIQKSIELKNLHKGASISHKNDLFIFSEQSDDQQESQHNHRENNFSPTVDPQLKQEGEISYFQKTEVPDFKNLRTISQRENTNRIQISKPFDNPETVQTLNTEPNQSGNLNEKLLHLRKQLIPQTIRLEKSPNQIKEIVEKQHDTDRLKIEFKRRQNFQRQMTQKDLNRQDQTGDYQQILPKEKQNMFDGLGKEFDKIKKIMYAQKFCNNIKERSEKYRMKKLTDNDYEMINDLSRQNNNQVEEKESEDEDAVHEKKKDLILEDIFKKKDIIFLYRGQFEISVIDPNSTYLKIWFFYMALLIPVVIFLVSTETVINVRFSNQYAWWRPFIVWVMISFIFHTLLKLNTGYYEHGQQILERQNILLNYLKNYLAYDLMTFWGLIESYQIMFDFQNPLAFLNVLILIQSLTWSQILDQLQEYLIILEQYSTITVVKLGRLFFMIIFVAHFFSICHLILAGVETIQGFDVIWMNQVSSTLAQDSWQQQYIWALYWNVTTMTTVGYGDITPTNHTEAMFQIIVLLFACGFFSYSFGLVGSLIQQIANKDNDFQEEMMKLSQYFRERNIPYGIQTDIRKVFAFQYRQGKKISDQSIESLLSIFDDKMRQLILQTSNIQYVSKCNALSKNFSQILIEKLSSECQIKFYQQGEIIYEKGQDEDGCIYFIESGMVEKFFENLKTEKQLVSFKTLKKGNLIVKTHYKLNKFFDRFFPRSLGDFFGEMSFILGIPRNHSTRAIKDSKILCINRKQFLKIIQQDRFWKDYQEMCQLRDEYFIQKDSSSFYLKCESCGSEKHDFENCHRIHFIPEKEKVLQKYHQTQDQEMTIVHKFRKKWKRKQRKMSSLVYMKLVKQKAVSLLQDDQIPPFVLNLYQPFQDLSGNKLDASELNQNQSQEANQKQFQNQLIEEIKDLSQINNKQDQIHNLATSREKLYSIQNIDSVDQEQEEEETDIHENQQSIKQKFSIDHHSYNSAQTPQHRENGIFDFRKSSIEDVSLPQHLLGKIKKEDAKFQHNVKSQLGIIQVNLNNIMMEHSSTKDLIKQIETLIIQVSEKVASSQIQEKVPKIWYQKPKLQIQQIAEVHKTEFPYSNFDAMCNYKVFNPQGNPEIVIKYINDVILAQPNQAPQL